LRQRWPPGHKATKADIARHVGSLTFQETFKELMTKMEEVTAKREERWRRDKEATTKSFIDLQERSVATDEAIARAIGCWRPRPRQRHWKLIRLKCIYNF
jgi:hypothetical protein